MQPNYVLAFRKRLSNRGYTDISIYSGTGHFPDWYRVCATEPLSGKRIDVILSVNQICSMFK